jgi:hypothetical protein
VAAELPVGRCVHGVVHSLPVGRRPVARRDRRPRRTRHQAARRPVAQQGPTTWPAHRMALRHVRAVRSSPNRCSHQRQHCVVRVHAASMFLRSSPGRRPDIAARRPKRRNHRPQGRSIVHTAAHRRTRARRLGSSVHQAQSVGLTVTRSADTVSGTAAPELQAPFGTAQWSPVCGCRATARRSTSIHGDEPGPRQPRHAARGDDSELGRRPCAHVRRRGCAGDAQRCSTGSQSARCTIRPIP